MQTAINSSYFSYLEVTYKDDLPTCKKMKSVEDGAKIGQI